jgi:hypothetical protein
VNHDTHLLKTPLGFPYLVSLPVIAGLVPAIPIAEAVPD